MGILSIGLLIWQANYQEVLKGLKALNPWMLLCLCLLQILTMLLINFQWYHIAIAIGEKVELKTLFHINMAGTFVESITPSAKAGGEATKVYLLKSQGGLSTGKSTALVGIQKTLSLGAFLFLNFISISWFVLKVGVKASQLEIISLSFLFLILVLVLLLTLILCPRNLQKITKILPDKNGIRMKVEEFIISLEKEIKDIFRQRKKLYHQIILSLIIWLLFAIKAYLIVRGLRIELSFVSSAVIAYLTYMVGMIPLLPGGIGTFEGSMVLFLLPMGISHTEGILLALILRFVTFWFVFILSSGYLGYQQLTSIIRKLRIA